jgi:hypothetical protein
MGILLPESCRQTARAVNDQITVKSRAALPVRLLHGNMGTEGM